MHKSSYWVQHLNTQTNLLVVTATSSTSQFEIPNNHYKEKKDKYKIQTPKPLISDRNRSHFAELSDHIPVAGKIDFQFPSPESFNRSLRFVWSFKMDLSQETEDYIRESIEYSLGLPVSSQTLQLKLRASEESFVRLRTQYLSLRAKLKEKDETIERSRVFTLYSPLWFTLIKILSVCYKYWSSFIYRCIYRKVHMPMLRFYLILCFFS